ncbi:MAG: tetratricopeptide repeat protein, partial [Myxococcota bacterium]
ADVERGARERHCAHYAARGTHEAMASLSTHGCIPRGRALIRDFPNLQAALVWAERHQLAAETEALAKALTWVFRRRGPSGPWLSRLEQLRTAPYLNREAQLCLTELVLHMYQVAGRTQESLPLAQEALDTAQTLGLRTIEAKVHYHLGHHALITGEQFEVARYHHQQAIALGQASTLEPHMVSLWKGYLGSIERALGNLDTAIALFEEALLACQTRGDRFYEPSWLIGLAMVTRRQGKLDDTRILYEQALPLARATGDREDLGIILNGLAIILKAQGRTAESLTIYREALRVHTISGATGRAALVRCNLANTHRVQGRLDQARALYLDAMRSARALSWLALICVIQSNIAELDFQCGDLDQARQGYEDALAMARQLRMSDYEAHNQIGLARIDLATASPEKATTRLNNALKAFHDAGNQDTLFKSTLLTLLASAHTARDRSPSPRLDDEADITGLGRLNGSSKSSRSCSTPRRRREVIQRVRCGARSNQR